MKTEKKAIGILGSTGSIGTQALEVIEQHPSAFGVEFLTAGGNADLLIAQAQRFRPGVVVIGDQREYKRVEKTLYPLGIKVFTGAESMEQVTKNASVDLVLSAIVGFAGLKPTIKALEEGKDVALANKEALVIAGELVQRTARETGARILPVDSEHSAIFQCLNGEKGNPIEKIHLTASGGPFRGKGRNELKGIGREQALDHPTWNMGNKITIDSASLMNKGLEVIEASWLFDLPPERIEVLVHPQSVIHSMVQFRDGSIKAEMGVPDMKQPILYALGFPYRFALNTSRLDFSQYSSLTFEKPDTGIFRNLELAFQALRKGGGIPCVMNAANEEVVGAFLEENLEFLEMPDVIEECMEKMGFISTPGLEDYIRLDRETRELASKLVEEKRKTPLEGPK